MPVRVDISINDEPIESIWIGRQEKMRGADAVHQYLVRDESGNVGVFHHRYSEGVTVCVEKALAALNSTERTLSVKPSEHGARQEGTE